MSNVAIAIFRAIYVISIIPAILSIGVGFLYVLEPYLGLGAIALLGFGPLFLFLAYASYDEQKQYNEALESERNCPYIYIS